MTRDTCRYPSCDRELAADDRVVSVWGIAETGPRRSWLPADHPDGGADDRGHGPEPTPDHASAGEA